MKVLCAVVNTNMENYHASDGYHIHECSSCVTWLKKKKENNCND